MSAAPYKYPRAIEFVNSLQKTVSGKIKRNELREREMKNSKKTATTPVRECEPLSLCNFIHNVYKREGSQARSTASGSGPDLAGVLGFESHPSHLDAKLEAFSLVYKPTSLTFVYDLPSRSVNY